ncbi:HEAT repeat domain-containing protein [Hyphococcus lacteus]|uniref:HEAT repeat domain-containing protein n=1 Tax=Hyphococcus lacteus TaxID=3143536 RepID=A0ABV3Z262_9PROT
MKKLFCLFFCTVLISANAWAQDRATLMQDCLSISDCLEKIEQTLPIKDNGRIFGDERQIATVLKARFGRQARDELLKRAVGDHGGWRNFTGGVLRYWGDWSEDDVPILKQALELNPGGSIAHVLAEIGSDEAIAALFDDLIRSGGANQTGFALRNLGPEVLNYALPALSAPSYDDLPEDAPYTEGWRAVASLIGSFGSRSTFIADDWIAVANKRKATNSERIAALRGLAAMNGYLGNKGAALRRLLRSRNREIANQTYITLVSTYDPTVARRFAETCRPSSDKWDEFAFSSFDCLSQLSDFGSNARDAGDLILPFLNVSNKIEQLYAIEALGLIGYEPAIPEIEKRLESPDWRFAYASVRALAQMNSKSSVPKIELALHDHWLPELNNYAIQAVRLLIKNHPYSETMFDPRHFQFHKAFGNYTLPYDVSDECKRQVWVYGDEHITFEQRDRNNRNVIPFADGELVGTDQGEFGGNLTWKSNDGSEVILVNDNTIDIFPIDGGLISIHGLSHMTFSYGYAAYVTREDDGSFSAEEIARFPGAAYRVAQLSDGMFAAEAEGRVVIFSKDGIQDMAYCDWSAGPDDPLN